MIFVFLTWRPPPSWIFKNSKNFNGGSAARGQCASPCQILSKSVERLQRYGDLTVFIKMAAVRHLGFVGRLFGPPTMTNWWCLSLCQIRLKSMEWFRQHETVNILPVWLENFYSRSKIGVFGGFSPNMFLSLLFYVLTFLFNMYSLLLTVISSRLTSCN